MELWFLRADEPLTKQFTLQPDGTYQKTTYPNAFNVSSSNTAVETIEDFYTALRMYAHENYCLMKGPLSKTLINESRAGLTLSDALTEWVVFDIDGLEGINTAEEFIHEVLPAPFHDASYVAQLSCSSGITGTGLRMHLFFLLDAPCAPDQLKRWLTELNLDTPVLARQLRLGAGGMSLRFALDRSVADNSKLIFIAPPACTNFTDPLAGERIKLVSKLLGRVTTDCDGSSGPVIQAKEKAAIERLRAEAGLEARKFSTRREGPHEVLRGADKVEVTNYWERNGFIRLNLNGGDSGAYYVVPGNFKLIHNFKGEPSLITKEVAPEFYREIQEKYAKPDMLVFRDIDTDKFFHGVYRADEDTLEWLRPAKETNLKDWAEDMFQIPLPDPVPQYFLRFDPTNPVVVDRRSRFVNWFWPTDAMRLEVPDRNLTAIPPTIERVIRHVVNNDEECFTWFINWLAYIFQRRDKTGTAVVFQGVPGTGKGIIYEQIIRKLFGQYTRELSLDKLEQDLFNSFLDRNLVLHINEAQANEKMRNQMFMWITDHFTSVRRAYQEQQDVRTFCNFIFSSNHHNAVRIEKLDRRYTVCPWQDRPLYSQEEKAAARPVQDIEAIARELDGFARYLLAYEVDEMRAHTPIENDAKEIMRGDAGNSLDDFADAINHGDFGYFLEIFQMNEGAVINKSMGAEATLKRWAEGVNTGKPSPVSTAELKHMYQYVQQKDVAAAKFNHLLTNIGAKRRGHVTIDGRSVKGIMVDWTCEPRLLLACKELIGSVKAPTLSDDPADRTVLSMTRKP